MSSRPPTPSTDFPKTRSERRFKETHTAAEWAEEYRPGGLHPIDIGTGLKHGQYQVLRKLGYGGFSTVWLAIDTMLQRIVAVKVGVAKSAEVSQETSIHGHVRASGIQNLNIVQPMETFEEVGPNGTHKCLVFEAMGPSVACMFEDLPEHAKMTHETERGERSNFPLHVAKKLLKDMLVGIDALHSAGIVHGDLQFGNLLMKIKPLSVDAASSLEQDVSGPRGIGCGWGLVERRDGKKDPWAPKRVYIPMPLTEYVEWGSGVEAKLSDLGGAFPVGRPPAKIVTPIALRAPEVIFESKIDEKLDIWSFGCLMFEMLTGIHMFLLCPFGTSDETLDDEHILMMIEALGKLPPHFRDKWRRSDRYLDSDGSIVNKELLDEDDYADESMSEPRNHEIQDVNDYIRAETEAEAEAEAESAVAPERAAEPDPITEAPAVHQEPNEADEEIDYSLVALDQHFANERQPNIDDAESRQIVDLLSRMLQYNPEDRPSSRELLQDP